MQLSTMSYVYRDYIFTCVAAHLCSVDHVFNHVCERSSPARLPSQSTSSAPATAVRMSWMRLLDEARRPARPPQATLHPFEQAGDGVSPSPRDRIDIVGSAARVATGAERVSQLQVFQMFLRHEPRQAVSLPPKLHTRREYQRLRVSLGTNCARSLTGEWFNIFPVH